MDKLNVIILSQVWIGGDELLLFNIPGFNFVGNCNISFRAGGVFCCIRESIIYSILDFPMNYADCLLLQINTNNIFHFHIMNWYIFYTTNFYPRTRNKTRKSLINTIVIDDLNKYILKTSNSTKVF